METENNTNYSYLTFRLAEEIFAANVLQVSEILQVPKITKVPCSPPFLRGVINLRGSVLPVVDARMRFALPENEDTVSTCIIVLQINLGDQPLTIGAVVDSVQEVMEIPPADIQDAPTVGSKYKAEFIDGMVKHGDQFIMVINPDKVFSFDEINLFQELTA